jgi:hypothetical protein
VKFPQKRKKERRKVNHRVDLTKKRGGNPSSPPSLSIEPPSIAFLSRRGVQPFGGCPPHFSLSLFFDIINLIFKR